MASETRENVRRRVTVEKSGTDTGSSEDEMGLACGSDVARSRTSTESQKHSATGRHGQGMIILVVVVLVISMIFGVMLYKLSERQSAYEQQVSRRLEALELVVTAVKAHLTHTDLIFFALANPERTLRNEVPVFRDVLFNTGGGYDTATGRFTCTVSGLYQFSVILERHFGGNLAICNLYKNAAYIAFVRGNPPESAQTASTSVFQQLSVGDYVDLKCPTWSFVGSSVFYTGALIKSG